MVTKISPLNFLWRMTYIVNELFLLEDFFLRWFSIVWIAFHLFNFEIANTFNETLKNIYIKFQLIVGGTCKLRNFLSQYKTRALYYWLTDSFLVLLRSLRSFCCFQNWFFFCRIQVISSTSFFNKKKPATFQRRNV